MLILVFGTLLISEVSLRLVDHFAHRSAPGNEKGIGLQALAMKTFVQDKINSLWIRKREERKNIFEPPFDVFVNKDFSDSRLNFIKDFSKLPPGQTYTVENFLRLNKLAQNEEFTVTSNVLGFRNKEYEIKKPKDVYRIVVLGSYPAFGHAVNDDETYAAIIENELNKKAFKRKHFEVWNGGKQGATSIMGYARLKNEVKAYSPDLIIWDYGWIELYLGKDMVKNNSTTTRLKNYSKFEGYVLDTCLMTFLSKLDLCRYSVNKITKVSYSDAIVGWQQSMELVGKWAKTNKVPVVFLRHKGVSIPRAEYEKFHNPADGMNFLDTSASLNPQITDDELELFWSKPNWLSELNHTREEVMKSDPSLIFLGDAIQYNKIGYNRIGHFLSDYIIEKDFKF